MVNNKIKAAVIGGSGYVGGEIIKLLLFHPYVELIAATSNSHIGKKISEIHPNLLGITDLVFEKFKDFSDEVDVIFLALPHRISMEKIKNIDLNKVKVIDLSGDFRLKDISIYKKYYDTDHLAEKLLESSVYGLPEVYTKEISNANFVSCPGCFPTGASIPLIPLAKEGLLEGNVIIDAKTGSSGYGKKLSLKTHYSERAFDFKAYGFFTHRHNPEIKQEINKYQPDLNIIFTPHSAPMVRGIFTTIYANLNIDIYKNHLESVYKKFYENKYFIRLTNEVRLSTVRNTNYCDISFNIKGRNIIITSAIDNLIKGAGGQAVQNMNIIFGLDEATGLKYPGSHP